MQKENLFCGFGNLWPLTLFSQCSKGKVGTRDTWVWHINNTCVRVKDSSLKVHMRWDGLKGEHTAETFWISLHWVMFLKWSPPLCCYFSGSSLLWLLKKSVWKRFTHSNFSDISIVFILSAFSPLFFSLSSFSLSVSSPSFSLSLGSGFSCVKTNMS